MQHRVLFSVSLWLALGAVAFSAPPRAVSSAAGKAASAPAPSEAPVNEGLRLAQAQGRAETAAVDWVLANSGPLHGDTHAGGYRVAFTITPAEGWWDKAGNDTLAWHDAPEYNIHLRIFVLDLADGRLVPGLHLRATLIDANGNEQAAPVDYGWYPLVNAYGGNVPLIDDSSYTLRVAIDKDTGEATEVSDTAPAQVHLTRTTIAEFPSVPVAQNDVMLLPVATANVPAAKEAELLKPYNDALSAALTALWLRSVAGAEKPANEYYVAYALADPALAGPRVKNLFDFSGKDNVRLDFLVRDSRSGRFIPDLKLQATLALADGSVYDPGELPLISQPWLNLYGSSLRIPRKGVYTLHISFDAPGFRRWGRQSSRFAAPSEVEFDNLSLQPENANPEGK